MIVSKNLEGKETNQRSRGVVINERWC